MHVYLVLPENIVPSGGDNVSYQFSALLRESGFSASNHFESSSFRYKFLDDSRVTTYSPPVSRPPLKVMARRIQAWRPTPVNRLAHPNKDDLVLLPEYNYDRQLPRFRDVPHAVFAQDPMGVMRGVFGPLAEGQIALPETFRGFLTTSEISDQVVATFSDHPRHMVPLYLDADRFNFQAEKKKRIVFLPRKRQLEANILGSLFKVAPELADYEIRPLQNLPRQAFDREIAEALIFVSLSNREGFGLPPAEAMATGSLVVGYTGVGGDEFFTDSVGFPVAEDDTLALYKRVLDIATTYDIDPDTLDAQRRAASDTILARYNIEKTREALIRAVEALAKG